MLRKIIRLPKKVLYRTAGSGLILALYTLAGAALAESEAQMDKPAPVRAVGQACAFQLEKAQVAIDAKHWPQAERVLTTALAKTCMRGFEKSQAWNFLAYVYFSQARYRDAVEIYLRLIEEPETDTKMRRGALHSAAQLYFQLQNYDRAAGLMERWMRARQAAGETADPHTQILLAQTYAQLDKPARALEHVVRALVLYRNAGKLPPENWWTLQSFLLLEQEDYSGAVPVLKQLLQHYPRYRYWHQLGAIFSQLDKDIEHLVAIEIPYLAGALTREREFLSLAWLYLGADLSYQAAVLLDEAIASGRVKTTVDNLDLLGQAWQGAGDDPKARAALERAAELSPRGDLYVRLAGLYLDAGNYALAHKTASAALNKSDLTDPGYVHLLLGRARLNLHCYEAATAAFGKALRDKTVADSARQWLQYAEAEGVRTAILREAGAELPVCALAL